MQEDLGSNFNHKSKKIYKKKRDKKASFDRNNARNRDIYAISRATGRLTYHEDVITEIDDEYIDTDYEDQLIDKIDESK